MANEDSSAEFDSHLEQLIPCSKTASLNSIPNQNRCYLAAKVLAKISIFTKSNKVVTLQLVNVHLPNRTTQLQPCSNTASKKFVPHLEQQSYSKKQQSFHSTGQQSCL